VRSARRSLRRQLRDLAPALGRSGRDRPPADRLTSRGILLAQGISVDLLVDLIRDGLASASTERVVAADRGGAGTDHGRGVRGLLEREGAI
jgi:hypothetical protein